MTTERVPRILAALSGVVVTLVLASTGGSASDPDTWWHVRTGRLILSTHHVPSTDPWSFTALPGHWVPTAWLSDVLFGAVWSVSGYDGIRVLRVVLALTVVIAVAALASRVRGWTTPTVIAIAAVTVVLQPFLRERPQVLSYLFCALLAWQVHRVMQGAMPRVWLWTGLTLLWANLHGMWVLVPIFLVVAGVLAWWDDRSRVPLAARCMLTAIAGTLAAALTPVGPRLALWPLVVQHTAAPIAEWQPPVPLGRFGLPLFALLLVLALSWRAGNRTTTGRCAFVLVVGAFGFTAVRNTAPAAILLLPELVLALSALLASHTATITGKRTVWSTAFLSTGVVLALARLLTTPTIAADQPMRIVDYLAHSPKPLRVLNQYNVGGLITGFAAPRARVAIDGRTDMWSSDYVLTYLEATSGRGDWRKLVDTLQPNAAVLPDNNQVAAGLVLERGWHVVMKDHHWQLLTPP